MPNDYYQTLGVNRSASAEEIKRAYRKLALQYHPDKPAGNEEKFKEINEAYQVLGDPEKRTHYNRFGSAPQGSAGFGSDGFGFDPFEIFQREFTGFEDLFGDLFGRAAKHRGTRTAQRGDDRMTDVTLSFTEMARGASREITLERLRTCERCGGKRAEPGTDLATCATCSGSGALEQQVRTFFGIMIQRSICLDCEGEGKKPQKKCRTCSGTGRMHQRETLRVPVPAGLEEGTHIRLRGEGEAGPRGGASGDLYVTVHVKNDSRFMRDGNDLRSTVSVPFTIAALGGSVRVETLDGEETLEIPRGTTSGAELRLRRHGIGSEDASRGDQIVTVTIQVPKRLSREQEDLLKKLDDTLHAK